MYFKNQILTLIPPGKVLPAYADSQSPVLDKFVKVVAESVIQVMVMSKYPLIFVIRKQGTTICPGKKWKKISWT